MQTKVTIIRGKDTLLRDTPLEIMPRVGELVHLNEWGKTHYKVLKIEHEFSNDPPVHKIQIFVR
jgi:hypothetical protein